METEQYETSENIQKSRRDQTFLEGKCTRTSKTSGSFEYAQ
ncbi:hypothetical protein [Chlamydia abortus]|nr:hypothetical protein [Chlamydia abortus]SGA06893.1 Uncharacterised protein [Chlamydia abortus]SGA07391.1 Uncharacterised protein [Chlamydia abortus]SGA10806.1 Uncharacterised protein [Chlamydia abortus]SGA11652.1 Uncharacterised protein [Chlamydia abortus]SGA17459.1 Uncharacterised protein [Chlamydia abortus]